MKIAVAGAGYIIDIHAGTQVEKNVEVTAVAEKYSDHFSS